jgi:UDP-N-acetylmuramoyl-tripeptide--D-alanyl-D-alanine ligase
MALALSSFSEITTDHKIVILGDMLELGDKTDDEHLKVLNLIRANKPEDVFLVGPAFQKISVKSEFKSFPDSDKLAEYLKNSPLTGKTILIKGSRGIRLEKIYDLL